MNASAGRPRPGGPGVLLITPWYGGNEGGVAVATQALAHGLLRSGVSCVVLEMAPDGWLPRFRRGAAGEHIVSLVLRSPDNAGNPVRRAAARARMLLGRIVIGALARRHGLRIAHFHYSAPEYAALQAIVAQVGLASVATFHGSDLSVNLDDPLTRAATESVLRSCRAVTTVSRTLGERLDAEFSFVRPIRHVVHNGIPEDLASASTTPDDTRDIDVLFVGNLIPVKGVDVLIRALRQVHGSHPETHVTIVGDGYERERLEALARELGVADSVSFLGRKPRAELPALYRRARTFVLPSRREALPLVILEAQASGAAVVGTAVGGIPEIIADGETGVLVPPDDPSAMAAAIDSLLSDAARARAMACRGRAHALDAFSPDAMIARYLEVYRTALGAHA